MDRGRRFQTLLETEATLFKRSRTSRSLMIQNSTGDEAYQLVPGTNDGAVLDATDNLIDSFGVADFWLLRFKGTAASPGELDDLGDMNNPPFQIAPWLNGEDVANQDVVIWYAAHQTRVDDLSRPEAPQVITGSHIVGPVLRPIRW